VAWDKQQKRLRFGFANGVSMNGSRVMRIWSRKGVRAVKARTGIAPVKRLKRLKHLRHENINRFGGLAQTRTEIIALRGTGSFHLSYKAPRRETAISLPVFVSEKRSCAFGGGLARVESLLALRP
jgi:hypothetical protein